MITNPPRRHRLLYVPYAEVLNTLLLVFVNRVQVDMLRAKLSFTDCGNTAFGLPDTARIVSVHDDGPRAAFCFIIEDASFEVCLPGVLAPQMAIEWEVITLDRNPPESVQDDPAQEKLGLD